MTADPVITLHPAPVLDELQQLLDDLMLTTLAAGGAAERQQILSAAQAAGFPGAYIVCERCRHKPLPIAQFIFGHYVSTERAYRARHTTTDGPNAGHHQPGDARQANYGEYLRLGRRPRRPERVDA